MNGRPLCPACGRLGFCYWADDAWMCTRCGAEWSTRSGFLSRVGPVTDAQRLIHDADVERANRRSREACPHCHGRHDPAETGNPMCGWCLDGHLAEYARGRDGDHLYGRNPFAPVLELPASPVSVTCPAPQHLDVVAGAGGTSETPQETT